MSAFLDRVKEVRRRDLIPMPAPELAQDGGEFTIYLRPPALRDSDYASQAEGQAERVIRLFIRCARDAEGNRLVQDAELKELMREGGAAELNAVAFRAAQLVSVPTVEDAEKN